MITLGQNPLPAYGSFKEMGTSSSFTDRSFQGEAQSISFGQLPRAEGGENVL